MKFLLTSLFATSLLLFIGDLDCMPPKRNCSTVANKVPFVGMDRSINCKEKNGCTSQKILYRDGSSHTTIICPSTKKK